MSRARLSRTMGWVVASVVVGIGGTVACSSTTSTTSSGTNAPPATSAATNPPATSKGTTPGTAIDGDFCTIMKKANELSPKAQQEAGGGASGGGGGGTTSGTGKTNGTSKTSGTAKTTGTNKPNGVSPELAEFLAYLEAAKKVAPDGAADDLDVIITMMKKLEALDPDDLDGALSIALDEDVLNASDHLNTVVKDECGFELAGMGSGSSGSGRTEGTDDVGSGGAGGGSGAAFSCSSITPSFKDDESDKTSIYNVKLHVCNANPNATWLKKVVDNGGWSASGDTDWSVSVYTDSTPPVTLSVDEAQEVCGAMVDYFDSIGKPDVSITVGTTTFSSSSDKPTPLVTKSGSGGCKKSA